MRAECVPCLLKRIIFEARIVDGSKEREVVEEALEILEDEFEEGVVSAEVATKVHGRVYDILGTDDPYKKLRKWSNDTAEKLLPQARKIVESGGFRDAVLVAIAGNVLDFGYRDDYDTPEYLEEQFQNIIDEGLGYDDTDNIEEILKEAEEILFFTDNSGEIVFDTLLLNKIKEYGVNLTVVVKGEPVLTDATMEDALEYGIDEIADEVKTTNGFAVGVDFDIISQELEEELKDSDLIIAKGMANWESFSETSYGPIAFLTRSKCAPIAESMGVPLEKNIAKLFERAVSITN